MHAAGPFLHLLAMSWGKGGGSTQPFSTAGLFPALLHHGSAAHDLDSSYLPQARLG